MIRPEPNKKNYQYLMEERLKDNPEVLLHACCAPCLSASIRCFTGVRVKIYYYNPNILGKDEYIKRAREVERFVHEAGIDAEVIVPDYNHEEFLEAVKGHEGDPEGGERCRICYRLRLEKTAEYMKENFPGWIFATTLTLSPLKSSEIINTIGHQISEKTGGEYLVSDFKKKNGNLISKEMSEKYGLYRQDFCGCEFSKNMGKTQE